MNKLSTSIAAASILLSSNAIASNQQEIKKTINDTWDRCTEITVGMEQAIYCQNSDERIYSQKDNSFIDKKNDIENPGNYENNLTAACADNAWEKNGDYGDYYEESFDCSEKIITDCRNDGKTSIGECMWAPKGNINYSVGLDGVTIEKHANK